MRDSVRYIEKSLGDYRLVGRWTNKYYLVNTVDLLVITDYTEDELFQKQTAS